MIHFTSLHVATFTELDVPTGGLATALGRAGHSLSSLWLSAVVVYLKEGRVGYTMLLTKTDDA
jgi:hypothetical protein